MGIKGSGQRGHAKTERDDMKMIGDINKAAATAVVWSGLFAATVLATPLAVLIWVCAHLDDNARSTNGQDL